jgi:hypothetical protein
MVTSIGSTHYINYAVPQGPGAHRRKMHSEGARWILGPCAMMPNASSRAFRPRGAHAVNQALVPSSPVIDHILALYWLS